MRLRSSHREEGRAGGCGARETAAPGPTAGAAGASSAQTRPAARERRGLGWRTRDAGAAAVGTVGSGVLGLARLIGILAGLIAVLICLAIVLFDAGANPGNSIVKGVHEGANFFAGAFTGMIAFSGHPKRAISVDWGIAAVVYLILGAALASVVARLGRGGLVFERRHRGGIQSLRGPPRGPSGSRGEPPFSLKAKGGRPRSGGRPSLSLPAPSGSGSTAATSSSAQAAKP